MAEQFTLSINLNGTEQVVTSIGQVKKALKEAEFQALALEEQFGAGSQQVTTLRKNIESLRDKIGDAADATKTFAEGGLFTTAGKALQGVAGGFAAVQGAIGLIGVESKELEKQLLKVQSALALSQGLESIIQSKDAFINLATTVKTQVVNAFSTLRGALIATGLGALAISIGLIAANFDKVKKAVLNAVPGLEKLGNLIGKIVTKVTDFVGITSVQDREFQKLVKTTERANETIDQRIKLLEAQGGKEKEIYELQKQRNINELQVLREKLKLTGQLTEEEQKRFRELKNENAVLDAAEKTRLTQLNNKPKEVKKVAEQEKEIRKVSADELATVEIDKEKKITTNAVLETQVRGGAVVKINQDVVDANTKYAELRAEEKKQTETMLAMQTLDILSGLVDQNSIAGKGIAIAQAIINTYQGATKALAQGGIFGQVAAAVTIAAGLMNVKKIVSTPIPSAKGKGSISGGGGGSISGGGSVSPIQPQAQQAQLTQLNQASINAIGNQAVKAYVVESDVTSSQQRIAAIQQRARFN